MESSVELRLYVDEVRQRSETLLREAGPNGYAIATAIPALGVVLDSHYVGHEHTESVVVHLELAGRGPRAVKIRTYDHAELPVVHARRRSLLEHAGQLQELVERATGATVRVDVDELVLEAL